MCFLRGFAHLNNTEWVEHICVAAHFPLCNSDIHSQDERYEKPLYDQFHHYRAINMQVLQPRIEQMHTVYNKKNVHTFAHNNIRGKFMCCLFHILYLFIRRNFQFPNVFFYQVVYADFNDLLD